MMINPTLNAFSKYQYGEGPNVKRYPVSFPAKCAANEDEQARNMRVAADWAFLPLQEQPANNRTVNIVGFGPSLNDTWRQIRGETMTTSGAHDFLIERGKRPKWHCDVDPRAHKADMLQRPHPLVIYAMASVCHPSMWSKLQYFGPAWLEKLTAAWMWRQIRTFHVINGQHTVDWITENDAKKTPILLGGGMVGLTAIHVAAFIGFRKFRLFGMDCCFGNGQRHAGEHTGPTQGGLCYAWSGGRWWATTKGMVTSIEELLYLIDNSTAEIDVVGDGLLQSSVRSHRKGSGWLFRPDHIKVVDALQQRQQAA